MARKCLYASRVLPGAALATCCAQSRHTTKLSHPYRRRTRTAWHEARRNAMHGHKVRLAFTRRYRTPVSRPGIASRYRVPVSRPGIASIVS